jgi:hypothetical protein
MSVANVAAVDAALVAVLAADAALTALVPDGVYLDVAPAAKPPKTRFVIVQLQTHTDTEGFRAPIYEECRYRITARILSPTAADADAAAYRIHTLLETTVLAVAGYTHMATLRADRVRVLDVDAIDPDIRWQVSGGDYEVFVSPD